MLTDGLAFFLGCGINRFSSMARVWDENLLLLEFLELLDLGFEFADAFVAVLFGEEPTVTGVGAILHDQ